MSRDESDGGHIGSKSCMYYVYILKSRKNGTVYVGFSEQPKQRISDHNQQSVRSTKAYAPYEKVWECWFKDKEKALNFEKYLKTGSGIAFRNKHFL